MNESERPSETMEERRGGPSAETAISIETEELEDLPRRERERLMRRRLMLDAALSVFAEKGYADATLDEIAQRAEFGKGTLYNYFEGGKEEILIAVFDDVYAALHQLIERTFSPALVRGHPFRDVLEGFLTALLSFFNERQDQFMIMLKEGYRLMFNDEPEKAAYLLEKSEGVIRALVPAIAEAQRSGVLRDIPPHSIAHMIMGNVRGYHMHQCMARCRHTFAEGEPEGASEHVGEP
ncbi:MAG: TetR/AcrR family transcriptional regulator, partial [Rhodothermales bacterium]